MWNHVLEPATGEEDRRMWIRCPLGSDGGLCKARLPGDLLAKFLMESMSWLVGRTMKQLAVSYGLFQLEFRSQRTMAHEGCVAGRLTGTQSK